MTPARNCVQSDQKKDQGWIPGEPALKNYMACQDSEGSQEEGREREIEAISVLNPSEEKI